MSSSLLGSTIKSRLRLLAILLVFLPPTLSLGLFAFYARDYMQDKAYESLRHVLEYDKGYIERWMEERTHDVQFLASLPVVKDLNYEAMDGVFRDYMASHADVTAVVYVGPEGITEVDISSGKGVDVSDREYFKKAKQGETFVTDLIIGRTSGKPIIIFSAPVMVNGEFKGLVFAPVRMKTIDALLSSLKVGRRGKVVLLDKAGRRYSGIDSGEAAYSNATYLSEEATYAFNSSMGGAATFITPEKKQALGAALPINEGKWLLVGYLPVAEVLEDYAAFLLTAVVGGVITLLLITPLLLRLIRSLEQPMHLLASMAKTMAEGHFNSSCPFVDESVKTLWEVRTLADAFCAMQDMLGKSMEALKNAAITDQLTGLWNRRHLLEEGARVVDVCHRGAQDCACLMLDVDHFKRVNDTHGHAAGDEVLAHVGRLLRENLRSSDIAARFGGEEFTVVAPNADLRHAAQLSERLREAFACCPLQTEAASILITVSIGVAACQMGEAREPGDGAAILRVALQRADEALYRAKQEGRNRVVIYPWQ